MWKSMPNYLKTSILLPFLLSSINKWSLEQVSDINIEVFLSTYWIVKWAKGVNQLSHLFIMPQH